MHDGTNERTSVYGSRERARDGGGRRVTCLQGAESLLEEVVWLLAARMAVAVLVGERRGGEDEPERVKQLE